ncbi:MAG: Co2+/Mg2+ efflux protein ApaG [Bacteroidetes bacterium]|nr:Co2+/Mg2+ efflux protein ApaG [Bacteroidota bacterium]
MVKAITKNIEVSVDCKYQSIQSNPKENLYFFIYKITIVNKSDYTVKLLKRHWEIADSNGDKRKVDGEGVVGETPTIKVGDQFQYTSGCNLQTEIGYMEGFYTMKRLVDNELFNIEIPRFKLIVPAKLN